jgi:hypothetical protein
MQNGFRMVQVNYSGSNVNVCGKNHAEILPDGYGQLLLHLIMQVKKHTKCTKKHSA